MNDKFEDFHKGNKQAEDNLKRLNDQKSRTFFFNKNRKLEIVLTIRFVCGAIERET